MAYPGWTYKDGRHDLTEVNIGILDEKTKISEGQFLDLNSGSSSFALMFNEFCLQDGYTQSFGSWNGEDDFDEIYADDLHMAINDIIELVLDKKTSKLTVKINGIHQHTFTDPKLKNRNYRFYVSSSSHDDLKFELS